MGDKIDSSNRCLIVHNKDKLVCFSTDEREKCLEYVTNVIGALNDEGRKIAGQIIDNDFSAFDEKGGLPCKTLFSKNSNSIQVYFGYIGSKI